jgi:flavodoxin
MKTLVVFYSGSGSNRALAENLAARMDANVEEIVGGGMEGIDGMLNVFKAFLGLGSGIGKPKYDPKDYDLFVLVSPVYALGVPSQVRGYLNRFRGKIRSLAIASVSGAGKNPKAIDGMEKLAGRKAVAVLELKAAEDKSGAKKKAFPKLSAQDFERLEYGEKIDAFVRAVQKGF